MNSEIGMRGWYKIRNWDMGFVFNQELGCGAGFQSGTEMWSWCKVRNWDVGLVFHQELGCGAGLQSRIGMWGWFTIRNWDVGLVYNNCAPLQCKGGGGFGSAAALGEVSLLQGESPAEHWP